MKLSVIIVSYNVKGYLSLCISSALRAMNQLGEGASELIVVDNSSIDGSVDWVSSTHPSIEVIALPENVGFSAANNRGIDIAKGEWVLLLNPDTIVPEDTFLKVMAHVEQDDTIGGLGVPMFDGSGKWLPESKRGVPTPWASLCRLSGLWRLAPRSRKLNGYYFGHIPKDDTANVEVLSGAFMWMRRAALDQVGLLDDDFFMYGEDIDLSVRILQGGWVNRYYSDAPIVHFKGESTKKGSLSYVRVFHDAMRIFCEKHFAGGQAWAMRWMIRLGIRMRAFSAFLHGFVQRRLPMVLDLFSGFCAGWSVVAIHGWYTGVDHPFRPRLALALAAAVAMWGAVRWFGSADRPFQRLKSALSGLGASVALIFIYSLLPETLRVSRLSAVLVALILVVLPLVIRSTLVWAQGKNYRWRPARPKVGVLAADHRLDELGSWVAESYGSAIDLTMEKDSSDSVWDRFEGHDMVLFDGGLGGDACLKAIQNGMALDLDVRIVPAGMCLALGGLRRDGSPDEDLAWGADGLARQDRRRVKRRLDIFWAFLMLVSGPGKGPSGSKFTRGAAWEVLMGRRSWLGFHKGWEGDHRLPEIPEGVLYTGTGRRVGAASEARRLDLRHASDFGWMRDLELLMNLRMD